MYEVDACSYELFWFGHCCTVGHPCTAEPQPVCLKVIRYELFSICIAVHFSNIINFCPFSLCTRMAQLSWKHPGVVPQVQCRSCSNRWAFRLISRMRYTIYEPSLSWTIVSNQFTFLLLEWHCPYGGVTSWTRADCRNVIDAPPYKREWSTKGKGVWLSTLLFGVIICTYKCCTCMHMEKKNSQ